MTDIVERLRRIYDKTMDENLALAPVHTLAEAVAEIERLRKRVERWKAVKEIAEGVGNELVREERARLAEAVEVMRDCHDVLHRLTAIIPGNDQALVETTATMARARDFLAKMETKP